MKRSMYLPTRFLGTALLCASIVSSAFAQRLPKVQAAALRAPAGVKIDGNAAEWGTLKAFNNATEIFYTMANDNNNLYLVIQAKENLVVRKILAGGITLTINPTAKDKIKVTYPVFDQNDGAYINLRFAPEILAKTGRSDSLMALNNKKLDVKAKEIRTRGIKGVDTLISVYNTDGIKASGQFDDKLTYTYELAIPLKHLGLEVDGNAKFEYNITLNGSAHTEGSSVENIEGGVRSNGSVPVKDMMFFWTPTDFTGTYNLAKN